MRKPKSQKPNAEIWGADPFGFRFSIFDFRFSALVFAVCLLPACNEPPAINPWADDSIPQQVWSTPSAESILVAHARPAIRHRNVPTTSAPAVDESVPHFPLWWEDPFEDQGDKDGGFAWTWQDYFAMPYSYSRFILNTLGVPVSAVVQPPWASMVSDGRLEMRGITEHDAKMGHSPNPTAGKSDFGFDEAEEPLPQVTTAPASR